jgi:hypothetical protein
MAPVRESGTAIAAAGGALWADAAVTCDPLPFPLLPGLEVAAELGDRLAAGLGGERTPPFGSVAGAAAGSESVAFLDLVPVDDDDDGDQDIGAWAGRG